MNRNSSSFTFRSNNGRQRVLVTPCSICSAFNPLTTPAAKHPAMSAFSAIWDTGATGTIVGDAVIQACGLKQIGITQLQGVNSSGPTPTYLVNIVLPNGIHVPSLQVARGDLDVNAPVLIGMDIITLGDFAVTNVNGITVFSYRVPSERTVDYVREYHQQFGGGGVVPPKQFGMNKKRRK